MEAAAGLGTRKHFYAPEHTVRPVEPAGSDQSRPESPGSLRQSYFKINAAKHASGSCYLEHGNTKIMCAMFGPKQVVSDRMSSERRGLVSCDFRFAPFASKAIRYTYQKDYTEQEYGAMIGETLETLVIPESLPNAYIDVQITVLEDGGCVLADAINAAVVACANAGVELADLVACCQIGIVNEERQHRIVLDPIGTELNLVGTLTLAYSCSHDEIIKTFFDAKGVQVETVETAVQWAIGGCRAVKEVMKQSLV